MEIANKIIDMLERGDVATAMLLCIGGLAWLFVREIRGRGEDALKHLQASLKREAETTATLDQLVRLLEARK